MQPIPKRDASQEALRQVEQIIDGKPVRGEPDLALNRQKRRQTGSWSDLVSWFSVH
jgi:hypothetical protein